MQPTRTSIRRGVLLALTIAAAIPAGAAAAPGDILVADRDALGGGGAVIRVDPQTGARSVVSSNDAQFGGTSFADAFGIALAADGGIVVADPNAFSGNSGGLISVNPDTGQKTA